MADEAATSATAENEDASKVETETDATPALGDAGKKALDAERREKRAAEKRAVELEAKLKELEDRDKTESQRLGEAADAYQKRAVEAEARALRLEVAAEKGLTPSQAKRLVGDSRDELEADADDLLENFKPPATSDEQAATRVASDLDLGTRGTTASAGKSPADEFAAIIRSQLGT